MSLNNLTHHHYKLIFTAVRNAQFSNIDVNYQEYQDILDALYPLAYTQTYLDDKSYD